VRIDTNCKLASRLELSSLRVGPHILDRCDGRKFKNHVRVGRIENEAGETTHFIGLFEKLGDDDLSSISRDDLYANT